MIAFVKGTLESVFESSIVVENHGIGYEILVPGSVIQALPSVGNEVKVFTYTHVREDAFQLFGFLNRDGLEMFRQLIKVSGVGPKGALGILTALDTDALRLAIISDDAKAIAKAPGIGAKTASKVILELRDKISVEPVFEVSDDRGAGGNDSASAGAVEALTALGYSASQSLAAVRKVWQEGMTVEEILKQSLKVII